MFRHKETVVSISGSKIRAANVILDVAPKVEDLAEFDRTVVSLEETFSQIKQILAPKSVRIIIGEELAYVVSAQIAKHESHERELVKEKIQELVPVSLENAVWDFKEVAFTKDAKIIQAFVIERPFYEQLSRALKKVNLAMTAIEPISYTLARLTRNEELPHLIIYGNRKAVVLLANHGLVLATEVLTLPLETAEIKKFLNFIKDRFKISPGKIIISGEIKGFDTPKLDGEEIEIEQKDLDPMVGMAKKADIKGRDEKVLNLELLEIGNREVSADSEGGREKTDVSTEPEEKKPQIVFAAEAERKWPFGYKKSSFLYLSIMAVTLLIIGGGFSFYRVRTKAPASEIKPPELVPITVTQETTLSPTPTPTPKIVLGDYQVQVLNGSGISGEASRVADLLAETGFKHFDIDNAEEFNYTDTVVRRKEEIPAAVFEKIKDALSNYNVIEASSLPKEEEYDIAIIVGRKASE